MEETPCAVVQRADCAERVIVLEVRVPGVTSWVLIGSSRVGLLTKEARQRAWGARLPPGFERQRAREAALEGSYVVGLGEHEAFVDQKGVPRVVRAQTGRVVVIDAALPSGTLNLVVLADGRRAELEAVGVVIAEALALEAIDIRRAEVARAIDKARAKIDRRKAAIGEDLAKIGKADALAAQAPWLVAEATRTPRGARSMTITDWSTGEAVARVVPLDPAKSAHEQVEAMFKRSKRLRLGGEIARRRMADTQVQAEALDAARLTLDEASTLPAIEEASRHAKKAAPRDVALSQAVATPGGQGKNKVGRIPYRAFVARSGRKILVGKGAADNDALTLKVARPHDLWLHTKERTGAHVIVPLERNETCPAEDLVEAAHLAAHFSDARDDAIVDVQYTPKRYLRKPKGSAPGAVVVDREKVLVLRIERDLLRALLEREEV